MPLFDGGCSPRLFEVKPGTRHCSKFSILAAARHCPNTSCALPLSDGQLQRAIVRSLAAANASIKDVLAAQNETNRKHSAQQEEAVRQHSVLRSGEAEALSRLGAEHARDLEAQG